jgi:hypothetical protein
VPTDIQYFPSNGQYWAVPNSIYAQYFGQCPDPCRKYHVSSALEGAEAVAALVLPYLASREIFHKVVKSRSWLAKQTEGSQVGKFITIYMNPNVAQRNAVIAELGANLVALQQRANVRPCHSVPKSRRHAHVFIEQPLDEAMFIYGGFVCDPNE